MQFRSFVAMATAASLAVASTPPGFQPATEEQLMVSYGAWSAEGGNNIPKSATQSVPTVGTASKLTGLSYAVMMVDMDVPTGDPSGATDTLLHWIAMDMTPAASATSFKSSSSSQSTWWALSSSSATTTSSSASVPYIGPNPPAQRPLTHRYAQFLLDTSDASSAAAVAQVASNAMADGRLGFDPMQALVDSGCRLAGANWFTVTNPGVGGGWGSGNGTGAAPSGTGVAPPKATGSTPAQVPVGGGPSVTGETGRVAGLAMGMFGVAGVFLML